MIKNIAKPEWSVDSHLASHLASQVGSHSEAGNHILHAQWQSQGGHLST